MESDEAKFTFPPFLADGGGRDTFGGDLMSELDAILLKAQWAGPLDKAALASALRQLHTLLMAGSRPLRRYSGLIGATIDALEDSSRDGWRLELKGPKGPRRRADALRRDEDIGWLVIERLEVGDGYEAAIAEACRVHDCGATKAAENYSLIRDELQAHRQEIRDMLAQISLTSRK